MPLDRIVQCGGATVDNGLVTFEHRFEGAFTGFTAIRLHEFAVIAMRELKFFAVFVFDFGKLQIRIGEDFINIIRCAQNIRKRPHDAFFGGA